MNKLGRIVIVALFVVAALAGLSAYFVPRYMEAGWFLQDIAAGDAPTTWKEMHKPPVKSAVSWTIEGRAGLGDLYTPTEKIKGRTIFVPGLLMQAREDARVIAFATSLARAGFVVLVPEMPAFAELKASPSDITAASDAMRWLADADIPLAPKTKVGAAALSYMAGPVFLAASRPPLNEQVEFVFAIGPYYSMADLLRFVTTRHYRLKPGDPWTEAAAGEYATWAFLRANALGIDDAADKALLVRIADAKLADEQADVSLLAAELGSAGKAVYELMTNRDPDKVEALMDALPAELRAQLTALDLSKQDLSGFQGDALLVHGKDDPLIASVESEKLAEVLGDRAHLYILEEVTHVEVNREGSFWDKLDMLFAGYRLLSHRTE